MEPFSLKALEFDRLKLKLAESAITALGRERSESLSPLTDKTAINRELSFTSEMKHLLSSDDPFPIHELKDIRKALKNTTKENMNLRPPELLEILATISTGRKIKKYLGKRKEKYPFLQTLTGSITLFERIEFQITNAIDEEGQVRDNASPDLKRIRREIVVQSETLRSRLEKILKKLSADKMTQEDLITIREGRMVIPVKDEYKNQVKGFVHDESATGQTVFIEPTAVLNLNNSLKKLRIKEAREVDRILAALTGMIRNELAEITSTLDVLRELDFIFARARLAIRLNAFRPQLSDENETRVVHGRHPLLLVRMENEKNVVPLNLELGRDRKTLIISGPNAGGKTVALKTVGLLSLMVQSGLLIPADETSSFCIYDQVFADIGDDQSIENDLSTFSSHIAKLSHIVTHVTDRSLVLVDEITTGTDPNEGSLLAISILKHLTQKNVTTICTSHHGALKAFAAETPGIENGSMEFDTKSLQPTYRFRSGVPGSSYAFEISARLGLDEKLISDARSLAGTEKQSLEKLLLDLEERSVRQQKTINELEIEKSRLQGLEKLYSEKMADIKRYEKEVKEKAGREAREIVAQANRKIELAVKQIREARADKQSIQNARTVVEREKKKLESISREPKPKAGDLENLRRGDRVKVQLLGLEGTVIDAPDGSDEITVEAGNVRVKVAKTTLKRLSSAPSKHVASTSDRLTWNEDISTEIDVRGQTAEEAVDAVDRYLGDAQVIGLSRVTVIHGKGTGVLRREINRFLRKDERVKTHRHGDYFEGDVGVTIVNLKT